MHSRFGINLGIDHAFAQFMSFAHSKTFNPMLKCKNYQNLQHATSWWFHTRAHCGDAWSRHDYRSCCKASRLRQKDGEKMVGPLSTRWFSCAERRKRSTSKDYSSSRSKVGFADEKKPVHCHQSSAQVLATSLWRERVFKNCLSTFIDSKPAIAASTSQNPTWATTSADIIVVNIGLMKSTTRNEVI